MPTSAETEQAEKAARQEVARQVVIEKERRTKRERDLEDLANGLQLLAVAVSEEHNGTPDVNTDVTTDQDEESEHDSDDEDWDSDDDDNVIALTKTGFFSLSRYSRVPIQVSEASSLTVVKNSLVAPRGGRITQGEVRT